MLLQGFPLHRLQLGTLSEQDWTHQPIPQPSNSSTQEIGDLGGNSMHLRSMACAWAIALKAGRKQCC